MKKIATLLVVVATALAAHATRHPQPSTFNVPIVVTVNDALSEQTGVISIVEDEGLYDLTLKNFMLSSEDGPMGVGNVTLNHIKTYTDGNATLLLASDQVTITDGDDPTVPVWMASMLPPVPVELRGKIEDGRLRCFLDIDLMSTLGQMIRVAIGFGYQMPNPSFETWHTSTGDYVEPNAWHSFESATGGLAALAGHHISKSGDAHSGQSSARIFATSIFGIVANGTMTTGRMNAGSIVASDKTNNAYLDMSTTDVDGNGDPFYVPLYARPDSITLWVKFKQGTPNISHPYATVSAVITDGTYYQDPEDKDYTNVVARAKNNEIATTDGHWQQVTIPFDYTENAVDPKAVLITVSTNADAGQGSANDEVLIDDIAFIYNAQVANLKIKGHDVPDFSPDNTAYEMELSEAITPDDIDVIIKGERTAHIVKTVETTQDAQHPTLSTCTVHVINADMSAMTTYVIKVTSIDTAITPQPSTLHPQPSTLNTLDGRQVNSLEPGHIYIYRQADGTTTKILRK